ncbi:tetratricopeptide repeat protein [Pseudalkalibacillus sp. SCS-8]|uniref:tetratricopeptide repeat protein n=1 Tax=Pseudalkalibacillus nanhaiensis TaxID=3115291 RepID=UPI0032DADDBE
MKNPIKNRSNVIRNYQLNSTIIPLFIIFVLVSFNALSSDGDDLVSLNEEAVAMLDNEDYEAGLELVEVILEKDPDNNAALVNKGFALNQLERFEETIEVMEKSIKIQPNDAFEYIILGDAHLWLEEYVEAMISYKQAIQYEITHETADAYYGLGLTTFMQEFYEPSIENFNKYLDYYPNDPAALWYVAIAHERNGDIQSAIMTLDDLIQSDQTDIEAMAYKGELLLEKQAYQSAIEAFEDIIDLYPETPHGYYGKAQVLSVQNKTAEALTNLRYSFFYGPEYSKYAFSDPLFESIEASKGFRELVAEYTE